MKATVTSYLWHPLQECMVSCVGMMEVMSTSFLRHPTHMFEGLGVISIPHTQHNMVGMAPYSSVISAPLESLEENEWWNGWTRGNHRYHGRHGDIGIFLCMMEEHGLDCRDESNYSISSPLNDLPCQSDMFTTR